MAVTVLLASGEKRVIEAADDARIDADYFFVLTRCVERLRRPETVLTLAASDVVWAEVKKKGQAIRRVPGAGSLTTPSIQH